MVLPFLYFYKYIAERGCWGYPPTFLSLWNNGGKVKALCAFFLSDIVPTMRKLAVTKTIFSKITPPAAKKKKYGRKNQLRPFPAFLTGKLPSFDCSGGLVGHQIFFDCLGGLVGHRIFDSSGGLVGHRIFDSSGGLVGHRIFWFLWWTCRPPDF